jgi:hypothetical protein
MQGSLYICIEFHNLQRCTYVPTYLKLIILLNMNHGNLHTCLLNIKTILMAFLQATLICTVCLGIGPFSFQFIQSFVYLTYSPVCADNSVSEISRLPRRVGEKNRPICSPTHFCQYYYITYNVEISSPKIWATSAFKIICLK